MRGPSACLPSATELIPSRFRRRLFAVRAKITTPRRPRRNSGRNIEINIGKLCNNACIFCGNGTVPKVENVWVAREHVLSEIARAAAEGYRSLGFLGGEVTVYPHALEAIRTARQSGFLRIALCTNGRALAKPGALDSFLDAGATRIALSIHSHRSEVENALCGRKGAFEQKLAAIGACLEAAGAGRLTHGFSLNTCVHGGNFRQLEALARFFHRRGVRDIRFNSLRPEHQAVGDRALVPRFSDVIPELIRLVLLNERSLRITMTFGDFPLCTWPAAFLARRSLSSRYIGELRDLDTSVTVFRDRSAGGAPDRFRWKDRRLERLKRHTPACRSCAAGDACEGPWARYLEMYGDEELHAIARA